MSEKKMLHPVSEIPFFEKGEVISKEIKQKYQLERNAYRMEFARGHGGSRKEETWDKEMNRHTCCNSAVAWRHKVTCPGLTGDFSSLPTTKDTSHE